MKVIYTLDYTDNGFDSEWNIIFITEDYKIADKYWKNFRRISDLAHDKYINLSNENQPKWFKTYFKNKEIFYNDIPPWCDEAIERINQLQNKYPTR